MKVLILATDAYGGYGGIAQYNRDFVEALCQTNVNARVELLVRVGIANQDEIPANAVQFKPIYSRLAFAAFALLRGLKFKPDIIISAHLYHGVLALIIARLTGARLINQLHGTEVWTSLSQSQLAALEHSALVLCVSRDTRRRLIDQTPKLQNRVAVLPNTLSSAFSVGDRMLARQRFNLTTERVILTVSRLAGPGGYKGHDRIIKLLPSLAEKFGHSVVYLIAGTGEDRGRLEKLCYNLGVTHLVRFLGKVPKKDLPDLYRAADLFALPSTGEGFGIVFIEAMACGTPAIGLSVGGAPDALGDGELGYCVAPETFDVNFLEILDSGCTRDPELASKVQMRFGRPTFTANVAAHFKNMMRIGA